MLHSAIVMRSNGTIPGNGLCTTEIIRKGTIVWQLDEPTFTWREIKAWPQERFRAFERYGFQCGVDGYSLPEGLAREMNHSCDPSTWWADNNSLVARHDILEGGHVTYDYSTWDIDFAFEMECRCGALCCRGTITNRDYLDSMWQEQYGLNLPLHVRAAIETTRR